MIDPYGYDAELESRDRAMESMERAQDKLIYEISDLKRQLIEANLEILRLTQRRFDPDAAGDQHP